MRLGRDFFCLLMGHCHCLYAVNKRAKCELKLKRRPRESGAETTPKKEVDRTGREF